MVGYNVYRSASPSGPYTMVNSAPVSETHYTDKSALSGTSYYVIKSVDRDGDESPGTLEMTVTLGSVGGGGCFISTMAN